jgi:hypothetical protein
MAKPTISTTIDYIIGLPPACISDDVINGRTQTVMENSMPLARIYPGIPSFTEGHNIFTRLPLFKGDGGKDLSYSSLLNTHHIALNQPNNASNSTNEGCIVVAYLADSFPTDSFTNEYGENFLKGMTNILSENAASVVQFTGARTGGEFANKLLESLKGKGAIGKGVAAVGEGAMDIAGAVSDAIFSERSNAIKSSLLAGGRLDFPMVWKGSSFQPSYTMTVRLYNPWPGDRDATYKFIAAPIAALMLLALPISTDDVTYSWPFIHKIVSPGIYNLDPAFISNITVIKGGDQQQIAYNQRLSVVDVRIDFGSLYSSLLVSSGKLSHRPTLSGYIDAMVGVGSEKTGVKNFSSIGITPEIQREMDIESLRRNAEIHQIKNQAPRIDDLSDAAKNSPPGRVSAALKQKEADLLSRAPF